MPPAPKICVLGGRGAMGKVIVKCLLKVSPKIQITIADRQKPVAAKNRRITYKTVDLKNHTLLVHALKGHQVVINSTSHHFNLPVMKAALEARIHYMDLGGLFHYTRKQLKFHSAFQKRNLLAILGMGCAPGAANLLAGWAAEKMNPVQEIHIKVGGRAWGPESTDVPYAIGTIREELTLRPPIYHRGKFEFKKPMSGIETFLFPVPVGRQRIFRTIHSEVATLPKSFPGVLESSFKIGFSDPIIQAVLHPHHHRSQPQPNLAIKTKKSLGSTRDCEITAAVVKGRMGSKKLARMAYFTSHSKAGHAAGDWNTAWPPAIVAYLITSRQITGTGVFPPEKIVPLQPFLKALKKAGFTLGCKPFRGSIKG